MFLNSLLNIWNQLESWDRSVFIKLNSEWTNPAFDFTMPFLRNSDYWAPLYLFLLVFVTINFKSKGLWWFLLFLCTFAMTDMISSRIIKVLVDRPRPCNDPLMFDYVRLLLKDCGTGKSFTSTHAANHFGLATFFYTSFRKILPKWAWVGFAWAFSIIYAQVYVGVHYPLDVIAGGILGIFVGTFTGNLFNKRFGFTIFGNQPIVS